MRNQTLALGAALALSLALPGCADVQPDGRAGEPRAVTTSPAASSARAPRPAESPSDPGPSRDHTGGPSREAAAARRSTSDPPVLAYRRFVAAMDVMTASGGRVTRHLPTVATGVVLRNALRQASAYRRMRIHTTGRTRVLWATTVDLAGTGTTARELTVRACYDIARPKTARGTSAATSDAPTRWQDDMWMRLDGTAWKASFARTRATDC